MSSLISYDAIKLHLDGKKTPYQLDLEVKDRTPSIIPEVGDRVKIKSREWYEKWKNSEGYVHFSTTDCAFAKGMEGLCGRELTVRDIIKYKGSKDGKRWYLSTNDWYFVPEMFEEVYPVQAQVNPPFPRITLDNPGQLSAHCTEMGKDILEKYPDVSAKIKEAGKRLAAYTVAKGLSAKPKLKQVKTTRLMKITKL